MESGDSAATGAEGGWLEESLLDCAFAACDVEQTGAVPAWRIVEYLQAVMGRSGEEQQLQELRQMLELTAAGVALDLPTFRAVMRECQHAHCQQDGAHQALEHGWASSQKLEDLEDEVRQLQEEKRGLIEQNQRLEREQHGLLEEVTGLQEMNSALLAEAKGRKENLQAPEAQKDAILQELQMEISSLHRLLRQTLEALATKCQAGGRRGHVTAPSITMFPTAVPVCRPEMPAYMVAPSTPATGAAAGTALPPAPHHSTAGAELPEIPPTVRSPRFFQCSLIL
ncbi:uncharacterized protein [Anas platyrhynchos]|uniref:uncharacterized protein isoform X2 n=1 Tax=Anas platyrhynchos TaxID=8839 RepID=UPI003AF2F24D